MQQSTTLTSNWDTFNNLAERTLQEAPLSKEDLVKAFLRIEQLIFNGINHLLYTTTFTEDNLCYLLAEIASGIIKSRKVYKGRRIRSRISLNEEVEMGSENKRIFGVGFDLFKLSRMCREKAVPLTKRIIRSLRISTSHYENILLTFSKESENYCAIADELARSTLQLIEQRTKNSKRPSTQGAAEESRLGLVVSRLIDQLDIIEINVGCVEPNYLYGTVRAVRRIIKEVRRLQERILRAYSRLVLTPVRSRAQSEMEAFDLFQSGSLGLARAISLYDVRSGTSFPTFSTWWIRQKIFGSIKHSGPLIKLPGSVWEKYQQIRAAERHFDSDPVQREVYTIQDIADYCSSSVSSVELVKKKIQGTRVMSLESMVYNGEDGTEVETATDKALLDSTFDEEVADLETQAFIESVLQHLDNSSRTLVCLRFGVIDNVTTDLLPRELLREVLRQTACKAILQQSMVVSVDSRFELLHSEAIPAD